MAVVRKAQIVGVRNVDYTNRNGRQVHGNEYFFAYSDGNIQGNGVGSFFLSSDQVAAPLQLKQEIRVFHDAFNRNAQFTYVPE